MVGSLEKIDGVRIETLKHRGLEVTCSCKNVSRVPGTRLLVMLDGTTRIKDVIPLMHCIQCEKRDVQSYGIVD